MVQAFDLQVTTPPESHSASSSSMRVVAGPCVVAGEVLPEWADSWNLTPGPTQSAEVVPSLRVGVYRLQSSQRSSSSSSRSRRPGTVLSAASCSGELALVYQGG